MSDGDDAMTYVPKDTEAGRLSDLLARLAPVSGERHPILQDAEGSTIDLPDEVFDALVAVVRAMANGEAISVIPRSQVLTTQESADLLGMSRPTLVKLLEAGEIPFAKVGRHRRVRLVDLLEYQRTARKERRSVLDSMAREGQATGMYEATSGPPPRTR